MAPTVVSRTVALGALTAAGQLLIVGSLPSYSVVFDPGAYGEYLVFVGAVAVLAVFAGLRYDSAIVLPRSARLAAALFALVMLIASLVAMLTAAATLLIPLLVPEGYSWITLERHFGLGLATATVIVALQRSLTSWCVRGSRFLAMGVGQFIFCLVTVAAQLAFARVMGQRPALIWGYVCALGCQTGILALSATGRYRSAGRTMPRWKEIIVAARRYRRFPIYMVGYALASSVRDRLVQILLGLGAGADVVGRFGLAYRVMFAPNSLIYAAVSPVYYATASRGTKVDVGRFAAGLVELTFVLLLVPYVAFAIEAPVLADGLLSAKWHGTAPYLQALCAPALLLAATCWLDRSFDSFHKQNVAFRLEASFTLLSVCLIAGVSRFLAPVAVAWIFGIAASIYYWIYFLVTFIACGFPMNDFRRVCANGVLCAVGAFGCCLLVHRLPGLPLRCAGYLVLTIMLLAAWIRFGRGLDTMRLVLNSRVGTGNADA
jgi:O-antigen/teichoic acid export membrane protein